MTIWFRSQVAQRFADLVGQAPIVPPARFRRGRIARRTCSPAFAASAEGRGALFSKSLNCERPHRRALQQCAPCVEIARGLTSTCSVDAATYSKVERSAISPKSALRPARPLVVVLDEVHWLSSQAFDAC
jgi:hypothetical protein